MRSTSAAVTPTMPAAMRAMTAHEADSDTHRQVGIRTRWVVHATGTGVERAMIPATINPAPEKIKISSQVLRDRVRRKPPIDVGVASAGPLPVLLPALDSAEPAYRIRRTPAGFSSAVRGAGAAAGRSTSSGSAVGLPAAAARCAGE